LYQYAQRLNELKLSETALIPVCLTEQAQAYLASLHTLKLVPKQQAWFAVESEKETISNTLKKSNLERKLLVDLASFEENEEPKPYKRVDLLTNVRIQKEYTLILAKLHLMSQFPEFSSRQGLPDPGDAFSLYIQAEKYQKAIDFGLLFDLDITKVFSQLAWKCVFLYQRQVFLFFKTFY
jgi:nuclear pore complex protein Nup160